MKKIILGLAIALAAPVAAHAAEAPHKDDCHCCCCCDKKGDDQADHKDHAEHKDMQH